MYIVVVFLKEKNYVVLEDRPDIDLIQINK